MEYLIAKTIGVELTVKCIGIVSTSVKSIYNLTKSHEISTSIEITKLLKQLDIYNDINMVETLLQEINIEKYHSKTLTLCLENLKECILDIENNLKTINGRITFNNSIWFGKSFRSYSFEDMIESLKLLKLNFDNRKKNLFEIISINNSLIIEVT